MKLNLNDLMGIVQQVRPENRQKTRLKFTGNLYIFESDKENDRFNLDSNNIKSTKITYDENYNTMEIELG